MLNNIRKEFLLLSKKLPIEYLLLLNTFVFQHGDTLKFTKGDSVVDQWIMSEDIQKTDMGDVLYDKSAKVSQDKKHFIIYEQEYFTQKDTVLTKLSLYNADRKKIWERTPEQGRRISHYLTDIYEDVVILVTTDKYNTHPNLEFIKDNKTERIVDENEWKRIIKYRFSPNMKYLVLHVMNPYRNKVWDYIYFKDLQSKENWTYLFPTCVSCKKSKIDLEIDDNAKVEVIYKGEHRVFSRDGKLIDIYMKW